jgi:hypothetical protein
MDYGSNFKWRWRINQGDSFSRYGQPFAHHGLDLTVSVVVAGKDDEVVHGAGLEFAHPLASGGSQADVEHSAG